MEVFVVKSFYQHSKLLSGCVAVGFNSTTTHCWSIFVRFSISLIIIMFSPVFCGFSSSSSASKSCIILSLTISFCHWRYWDSLLQYLKCSLILTSTQTSADLHNNPDYVIPTLVTLSFVIEFAISVHFYNSRSWEWVGASHILRVETLFITCIWWMEETSRWNCFFRVSNFSWSCFSLSSSCPSSSLLELDVKISDLCWFDCC